MLHLQRTVPNWLECLPLLPDGSQVKATGGYEVFADVKAVNPKLFTVHRMVRGDLEHYDGSSSSGWFDPKTAKNLARAWFDAFVDGTFVDKIARHTDAVSWHNEIWADSQNSVEREERIAATEAAVNVWNNEYRPRFENDIRLIIGEAAPGNGMPRRIAELAIQSDNIVGYHPYEWWRRKVRSGWEERLHTSLRFVLMEQEWGLRPVWAFTEAGPLESAVTGWRAPECLGGDSKLYVDAVRLWIRDVAQTEAYKQNRIRGFALFTTFAPNDQKWGTFHTAQPELNKLAKMVREEWKPMNEPVPTNPPVTDLDSLHEQAWEVTVNQQVTGLNGIRLNPNAAIQREIAADNKRLGLDLQVVTSEIKIDGKTFQAAESLSGRVPRRVYVWSPNAAIYYFEHG